MRWGSRAVLAWRLSNTMDVSFCVSALDEALARFGTPDIFNTDQESQFTSAGREQFVDPSFELRNRSRWSYRSGPLQLDPRNSLGRRRSTLVTVLMASVRARRLSSGKLVPERTCMS